MKPRYETRIRVYCEQHGIDVPPAFGRNSPSRYAIVRMDCTPPKLVATTWFKTTDVVYYIEYISGIDKSQVGTALQILDFSEGVVLLYSGGRRLRRGQTVGMEN